MSKKTNSMTYIILGKEVSSKEEFNKEFKSVTGLTPDEFVDQEDDGGAMGYNFASVKGDYIFMTDSMYVTELSKK